MAAVVSRPWQPQQIALALSGPERQHQRQLDLVRGDREQGGDFVFAPDLIGAVSGIQPTAFPQGLVAIMPRSLANDMMRASVVQA